MFKSIILATIIILLIPFVCIASETERIKAAVSIYNELSSNDSEHVITVKKIKGKYARATISLKNGKGETDIVYLKKTKQGWQVLDQGTGVNPYELNIPREAW